MSIRLKIICVGLALPALLLLTLFAIYIAQFRDRTEAAYVEKARSICLTAESAREEMDAKWDLGLFTAAQLREYAGRGERDKLLAAVPVVTAWQAAMRKADEGGYTFRVPKNQPRNPKNAPDEIESEALRHLEGGKDEWYLVDRKMNAIRYFRAVKLTKTCLNCHGDPATAKDLWGREDGTDPTGVKMENWKVGEVHGAFEVIQSLSQADRELSASVWTALGIVVAGLLVLAAIFVVVIVRAVEKPVSAVTEELNKGADQVLAATAEVSRASQVLAQGATEQAGSLEQSTASLDDVATRTRQNADNAEQAKLLADEARQSAEAGNAAMAEMQKAMAEINEASDRIASVLKTIEEIAFQTNLLALNASVEAARAGEHGRGFSVVADEVRSLAQRSSEAAKNTARLIADNVSRAHSGNVIAAKAAESLANIVERSRKVAGIITEMSGASREQAESLTHVTKAVSDMDGVTQQNASVSEENASAAEQMSAQAESLKSIVARLHRIVHGGALEATGVQRPARALVKPSTRA